MRTTALQVVGMAQIKFPGRGSITFYLLPSLSCIYSVWTADDVLCEYAQAQSIGIDSLPFPVFTPQVNKQANKQT